MSREADNSISFGIGLLAGVLAGVAAGVLYSPKPGEKMRSELVEVAKNLSEKVSPDVETVKEASFDMIDKAKASIEAQMKTIQDNLKAKKMAEAKLKEEAESGIEY